MSYAATVKQLVAQKNDVMERRTDYRCKAHGCPNAGCMERDLCYFHWNEGDASLWSAITQRIRATWPEMANWGKEKEELEARKAAARRSARAPVRRGNLGALLPGDGQHD